MTNAMPPESNQIRGVVSAAVVKPWTKPLDVSLAVPGSKSLANRALLLAGVAEGESLLVGLPASDDASAARRALAALGVATAESGDRLHVYGRGLDFAGSAVDIGSSGTVGRFLPGLLAAAPAGEWRLEATEQLALRPLRPLLDALADLGADMTPPADGRSFPLRVRGGGLGGGTAAVSAARSSQFASGVLMAAPLCRGPATVVVRDLDPGEKYVAMTLDAMRRFGVDFSSEGTSAGLVVRFAARQRYRAAEFVVEADFNSAGYFLSLPLLVGGRVTVVNLDASSTQPGAGFLELLERLGATVASIPGRVSVSASAGVLRGGFEVDMRSRSEMALTLGVLAVFADAPVTMTNLAHIRGHETDRLAALAEILADAGVATDQGEDWIRVHPIPRAALKNIVVDPRDDHRLAMSFTLLGLGGNGVTITNPRAVDKTFPDFFRRLTSLGMPVEYA